jgi:hypothetical protein
MLCVELASQNHVHLPHRCHWNHSCQKRAGDEGLAIEIAELVNTQMNSSEKSLVWAW